mmetsp:Transcript_110994/g.353649  ORF Transcript_110994/g.353649 Transcript_110994/m.353649 type:complete len:237 (-) Transcript_110994:649-1359(-)
MSDRAANNTWIINPSSALTARCKAESPAADLFESSALQWCNKAMASMLPERAAESMGSLPPSSLAVRLARRSTSNLMASTSPCLAAQSSAVLLSSSFASSMAPRPSASATAGQCRACAAANRSSLATRTRLMRSETSRCGEATWSPRSVSSPSRQGLAPCLTSKLANSIESCKTAQVNGVHPCSSRTSQPAPSSMDCNAASVSSLCAASNNRRVRSSARMIADFSSKWSCAWSIAV